jgi:multicomponent Na+:H+ antiporter subunit F
VTAVFTITFGLLILAGLLTTVRLVRGPRTLDRILAVDVLVVFIIAGFAVGMAATQRATTIPLLASVALLSFVGTITAVRLAERREQHR